MSFSFKRPFFNSNVGQNSLENRQQCIKEEDWGDEEDDEIMEKFVMAATQVEKAAEGPGASQSKFGFVTGSSQAPSGMIGQPKLNGVQSLHCDKNGSEVVQIQSLLRKKEEELVLLKEQLNQKSARLSEVAEDLTKQNLGQKRHYEQTLLAKENELNLIKTKLKFKEIDLQTLEQRCRKLESASELASSQQPDQKNRKRSSGFDFLERDAFACAKKFRPSTSVAAVQTEAAKHVCRTKRKETVLTHLGPISPDVVCEESHLFRALKSLSSQLNTPSANADFSAVKRPLQCIKISKMSQKTIVAFSNVFNQVLERASRSPDCADFLLSVLEPFAVHNIRYLSSEGRDLIRTFSDCCLSVNFQFEKRLPNLLVLSAALSAVEHRPGECELLFILNTKKKGSLIKTLLSSYTEALKYILTSQICEKCGCYEEFIKQLYYSIEDNYSHYEKLLRQNVSFAPTSVLLPESMFLYSDKPSEVIILQKEYIEKTSRIVPLFKRLILNSGLLGDENTKIWLISALQSLKLFKNVLNDECEDVNILLEHLVRGDIPLSVLERRYLGRMGEG